MAAPFREKGIQGADATDQVRGDITFTWTPPAD